MAQHKSKRTQCSTLVLFSNTGGLSLPAPTASRSIWHSILRKSQKGTLEHVECGMSVLLLDPLLLESQRGIFNSCKLHWWMPICIGTELDFGSAFYHGITFLGFLKFSNYYFYYIWDIWPSQRMKVFHVTSMHQWPKFGWYASKHSISSYEN